MEELPIIEINLRDYYPFYTEDAIEPGSVMMEDAEKVRVNSDEEVVTVYTAPTPPRPPCH